MQDGTALHVEQRELVGPNGGAARRHQDLLIPSQQVGNAAKNMHPLESIFQMQVGREAVVRFGHGRQVMPSLSRAVFNIFRSNSE